MKRGQRSPIPAWAMGDAKLQEVIVVCLERRLGVRSDPAFPLSERMYGADRLLRARLPELKIKLHRQIEAFRAESCDRSREKAIRITDTEYWLIEKGYPEFLVAVANHSFRLSYKSNEVAEAIFDTYRVGAPQIRQVLRTLRRIGSELFGNETVSVLSGPRNRKTTFYDGRMSHLPDNPLSQSSLSIGTEELAFSCLE
jgi:hypothetical protein